MTLLTYVVLCVVFLYTCTAAGENVTIIELSDSVPTITWNSTSSESVDIHAEEGYQIQVDVPVFYVDGEMNNAVTMKTINGSEDQAEEVMFTYAVSGKPSYLFNHNKVRVDYVGNSTENHYVLQFKRVGELVTTTTTISTTSVEPMPTPAPAETATLTVYLYGTPAASYDDSQIITLRKAIGKMGTEYCELQNCPLNKSITWKNVQIEMIQQCSVMWENYDACIILTFALPVVKLEEPEVNSVWQGYQLNEHHLQILWDTYAAKYMGQINLSLYPVPDLNVILKYRIIIISVVTVVLVILVLATRHIAGKFHKKKRRLSDTVRIIDRSSDRVTQQSLPPHYLQELPPHFAKAHIGNFSDYNNLAYAEEDEKSIQPISNQINISDDVDSLDDASV